MCFSISISFLYFLYRSSKIWLKYFNEIKCTVKLKIKKTIFKLSKLVCCYIFHFHIPTTSLEIAKKKNETKIKHEKMSGKGIKYEN